MANPTVAVPPVPPVAPPGYPQAPPAAPGAYPAQPAYGQPPQGPPTYGAPVAAAPDAEPKKKRSKAGLIIGILVVLVLLVGGAIAAVTLLGGDSGSDLVATVDRCVIDADGTLTAAGGLKNGGGDQAKARMTVEFNDTSGGDRVDRSFVDVTVKGDGSEKWEATGNAGDDVQKVTCVVSKITTD